MAKRVRDAADDEVYLDNYHSNKRYLTEVISSSLNGLKVGDVDPAAAAAGATSPTIEFAESLSQTEAGPAPKSSPSLRNYGPDEMSPLDSFMSDESEESVSFRLARISAYDSYPGSPDRTHVAPTTFSPTRTLTRSYSCPLSPSPSSLLRQRSSYEPECRLPPSPSDPCPSGDLRRTALMRSHQLRALSPQTSRMHDPSRSAKAPPTDSASSSPEILLASPPHGLLPAQASRSSSSARSLQLEEDKLGDPGVGAACEEEMYRSDEDELPGGGGGGGAQKRRRRRSFGGDCLSRLKKGRFCEYGTGFSCSDTEPSFC